jgi:pilus assembly protein CpaE
MTNQAGMQTEQPNKPRGKVIAVCSAKGGIGRTIITVNLAVALNKKNIPVAILDGDFQFGDVALAMDLQNTFTIKDVIDGMANLDEHSLAGYLASHESGVKVLPAPDRPEFADLVTKDAINKIIHLMRTMYQYVVVDTEAGLNESTINIIEQADQILVVTNLEMTALKNTKLLLETLQALGLREKSRVIINRANMESLLNAEDASKILGAENPIYLPNDFQICSRSLNIGIPFVSNQGKSDVAKGVFKMAETLSSSRQLETANNIHSHSAKNHSLLSKWFKKKRGKGGSDL